MNDVVEVVFVDDKGFLDPDQVVRLVKGERWAASLSAQQIIDSFNSPASIVFSLFLADNFEDPAGRVLIGIARAITDGIVFSTFTDVIIHPEWRRRGYGTVLFRKALAHPKIKPTVKIISTRDAQDFYVRKFGFYNDIVLRLNRQ